MFAPEVPLPTVERLAELAADGRALEFAIGTGRVAVPLAERGVPVSGIELSTAMLEQLRTKADQAATRVTVGDMSAVRVPGEFHPRLTRWLPHSRRRTRWPLHSMHSSVEASRLG